MAPTLQRGSSPVTLRVTLWRWWPALAGSRLRQNLLPDRPSGRNPSSFAPGDYPEWNRPGL